MARSLRKGPFVDPSLQRKVDKLSSGGSKSVINTNLKAALKQLAGERQLRSQELRTLKAKRQARDDGKLFFRWDPLISVQAFAKLQVHMG
jgi:hypothetical protein